MRGLEQSPGKEKDMSIEETNVPEEKRHTREEALQEICDMAEKWAQRAAPLFKACNFTWITAGGVRRCPTSMELKRQVLSLVDTLRNRWTDQTAVTGGRVRIELFEDKDWGYSGRIHFEALTVYCHPEGHSYLI